MSRPRLISFAGSNRRASYNQAVIQAASDAACEAGAEVTRIRLSDYPLPLFDQDLEAEEGLPESALRLKELFADADGFLIASPEYNSSFTPLTKNVIDWTSRPSNRDEAPLSVYAGKSVLLLSASPGPLGGLRGLYSLREVFQNMGVVVYPDLLAVRSAFQAIDEQGELTDDSWSEKVTDLVSAYVKFVERLAT